MSKQNDLTEFAKAGFAGNENPHLYSSACWYAHELGAYFQRTGRSLPFDVRMGRGYNIRANDMLFKIDEAYQDITFVRVN